MKYFKLILVIILILFHFQLFGIRKCMAQTHGLGNIPIDPNTYKQHLKRPPRDLLLHALPSSYDARDHNIITPAKDQGTCGSCWAFATVGALESHLLKNGYLFYPEDLSEQQLLSCNQYDYDCDGGYGYAINHWASNGPIYENCFSYTATETPCYQSYSCTELGYRVYDWHTVPKTTYNYKYSLHYYGPSYWYFNVYWDFFIFWDTYNPGNVYANKGSIYVGSHAVLLIGWDDSKGAFLCKNSWGTGGPNGDGTFWIAYSEHTNDLGFGMSNFRVETIGCVSDSECDDRKYCNGIETCVGGSCQNGSSPCYDDGEYCNGTEWCNEDLDECVDTGNPCTSYYSVCNETTNQCEDIECFDDNDCNDNESGTIDICHDNGTSYSYCENTWIKKDRKKEFWEELGGCFINTFKKGVKQK